ncbi:MAG: hypothetical protein ACT4N2_11020 [Hyphomicrobium sp.]
MHSIIAGTALLCLTSTAGHAGSHHPSLSHPGTGIWKSVVPPVRMKGEFDNHDPIGLAAGKRIKADCSLNWTDPDTGQLFCFASATSLNYFLDWPKRNTRRARDFWTRGALTQ